MKNNNIKIANNSSASEKNAKAITIKHKSSCSCGQCKMIKLKAPDFNIDNLDIDFNNIFKNY